MTDTSSAAPAVPRLETPGDLPPSGTWESIGFRAGKATRTATQGLLYGILLAAAGVPVLPWGDAAGFLAAGATLAAAAGAGSFTRLGKPAPTRVTSAALVVGLAAMFAISRGAAAPSAVAAGAFLAIVVLMLDGREFLYGLVLGVLLAAPVLTRVIPEWLAPDVVAVTGAPYSDDAAVAGVVRFAALLLVAGLAHLSAKAAAEQREEQRLRAIEAQRQAEEAVATERATIARELHDVVAHHVSVMTLQAEGAAALVREAEPAAAIRQVAASGRDALTELRRMLGVLRENGAPGTPDADRDGGRTPTPPQPTLAELERLVRGTGGHLDVSIERRGDVRALPAGVELCAFRIVQEALTNVVRHAAASEARVTLDYRPAELVVEVTDDGAGAAPARSGGGGLGLVGMRERVQLLGGTLDAGSGPGTGYRVRAVMPLADSVA